MEEQIRTLSWGDDINANRVRIFLIGIFHGKNFFSNKLTLKMVI